MVKVCKSLFTGIITGTTAAVITAHANMANKNYKPIEIVSCRFSIKKEKWK